MEIKKRDFTFKEYINQDDWQLSFTGQLTGANGQRPLADIILLKKLLDSKDIFQPIEIIGQWFNALGIFSMVVTDYTLPQDPGGWSYQNFTIQAISEDPIDIKMMPGKPIKV